MSDNKIFSMGADLNNNLNNYQDLFNRLEAIKRNKNSMIDHEIAADLKMLPSDVREEVIKGLYLTEKSVQKQQERVDKIRQERYNIREGRKRNKQKEASFYGKIKDFGEKSYGIMSTISAIAFASVAFIAICAFVPGIVNSILGIEVAKAVVSSAALSNWISSIIIGGSALGILTYGSKKVFDIGDKEKSKRGAAVDKMQREELEESLDNKTGRYTNDIKKKIVLYPDEMGPEPTSVLTYSKIK